MRPELFDHRQPLEVRLVRGSEVPRFNALLDEHHFLGHHLFGRVLRYVATVEEEWAALVGFGSAALRCPREDYVGWSEATKLRRLRYVSNNQLFCVLPGQGRANVASAVLARTLSRLSRDAEAAYGAPVLLVETFTDPARHPGTATRPPTSSLPASPRATPGAMARGPTTAIRSCAGSTRCEKTCPRCPARSARRSTTHCSPRRRQGPRLRPSTLNKVVFDGETGLFARLCELGDHRKAEGVRHSLASVLAVCAAATLAGNRNPTEIAEWAADLPKELRLHMCRSPSTGVLITPSISTLQRVLPDVDREALDKIICDTLAGQVATNRAGAEAAADDRADDDRADDGPGPGAAGALCTRSQSTARPCEARCSPTGALCTFSQRSPMTMTNGLWSHSKRSTIRSTRSGCSAVAQGPRHRGGASSPPTRCTPSVTTLASWWRTSVPTSCCS